MTILIYFHSDIQNRIFVSFEKILLLSFLYPPIPFMIRTLIRIEYRILYNVFSAFAKYDLL